MSTRFTEERLRALDAAHPGLSDRLGKEPDSVLVRESGLPPLTVWRWRWSLGIPAHTKSGKKRRTTVRLRDPRVPKPDPLAPVREVASAWPDDPAAREVVAGALAEHSRAVVAHALDLTVKEFSAKLEKFGPPAPPRKNVLTPERLEARYPGILARLSRDPDPVVGAAYGLTRSYVQSVRAQFGLPSRQEQREATYESDVVPLLATMTNEAIEEKTGIKRNVVRRLRRKHNVPEPTVERPKHVPPSKAYDLRVSANMTWSEIKEACGFTTTPTAIRSARLYALAAGKPWPVPGSDRRRTGARRVGGDTTETPSRPSTMNLGTSLPLSSINVLSDAFGRSNRVTKDALVLRIAKAYDPRCIGTLVLLRRKSDKKVFIIDGHHRKAGLDAHCAGNNVDPKKFDVRVDIYEEADIPSGTTPAEFIDQIRTKIHDRAPETFLNEVQRRWSASPWKEAYDALGQSPVFTGSAVTIKMTLQARLMADQVLARHEANPDNPHLTLNKLPGTPKNPVLLDALSTYPKADALRTVRVLHDWETQVGHLSGPVKGNFRTLYALVFALLVAEDPANARNKDLFEKIGPNIPKAPTLENGLIPAYAELLRYANYRNQRGSRWVHLLGRTAFGKYEKA